ncbi:gamma-glutamylcyclotransferase [Photobacterium aphoticum]|uniref:Gamma-glutamylcyclotransferase family protein n=1 Tax=Photobacterium aphoticum TaxID=754436 RepID=A0A0J1GGD3_9GAMM|nr:gamma-glutamylcyclotransferase family protein [Photobacterium aphoticum]KLU98749.1 hypothetical protein ABT58_20795 [Photobacterium aphoticum]PSU54843.1 gamma-glutamylcyclotransferase [Photobacterium aphoticum]GHA65104.1 gamma-glutamylcyclotransferase [Photobacterium aphoticum]
MLVFAYGTLRAGESNAHFLAKATRLGAYRLPAGYRLYDLGAYPAAIEDADGTGLTGEVYAIDDAQLAALDRLEEYPEEYDRVLIKTPWGEAWLYVYNAARDDALEQAPLIAGGDWCQRTRPAT